MIRKIAIVIFIGISGFFLPVVSTQAANDCVFDDNGDTLTLTGDCTTDETIFIPNGYTLNGNGYTITAKDPIGGFKGAIIQNDGAMAYVEHLNVAALGLSNSCKVGADRLRGIMFEGASGSITHCIVSDINKGPSGCQEGNAIEIRNAPFDGTHQDTQAIEISHNNIINYQKTGIVANGDVDVSIHHNQVGASATQENLAANSIQLGFGATGIVTHNNVQGNQWMGTSNFAASAILTYLAELVDVSQNNIRGNSDVGIFVVSDEGNYDNNRVFDVGPDHPNSGYDIGVGNYGADNIFTNNKAKGFETPYDGVTGGKNKVIPGPQSFN